ncbi:hypothetical protein KY290_022115 [Solanum tuberosum]|uniref:TF-B3 domain-containing protein n=1 Tax=Solanum tuberosum TaxID=4113 RepID=A0ABQ7V3E5_SOLTU|nr:hypothetical protein KY284_021094 [Solanum tuberosum]KAH0683495.1 hypothetical protein KY289_021247 [Solanum tuberosum]KAH0758622.1 hypothetical protein KY290_022115 [Solanum tuberosum]
MLHLQCVFCLGLFVTDAHFMQIIPAAFGNRFVNKGEQFNILATLQTGSGSWLVKVHRSVNRLLLTKGMGKFICTNNLRVGDCCRFELIDEEKFILGVSIRRFPR